MAETKNSAPGKAIKGNHDDLPVLNADLINIPDLCKSLAVQHRGMTEGEACQIMLHRFLAAPAFSSKIYKKKRDELPTELDGAFILNMFELEAEEDHEEKAYEIFIRRLFMTEWWKASGPKEDRVWQSLYADYICILKNDAPNFGVSAESVNRYQSDKFAGLHSLLGWAQTLRKDITIQPEHDINQPGLTATMPEPGSEETENQKLKRTLAALVLGLSKQPRYKTGEKPNISVIAELALGGVTPENGKPPFRYGKTTFTDAINSALKFKDSELDK